MMNLKFHDQITEHERAEGIVAFLQMAGETDRYEVAAVYRLAANGLRYRTINTNVELLDLLAELPDGAIRHENP